MPRIARVVVPGCWHHITQRGNHQQTVFFGDASRTFYLDALRDYCSRHSVRITGYCLMGNHVHILAVPERPDGLAKALGGAHNDYARWLHLHRRESGHLWQNRFYSCPLDEAHQWEALRYVELNPVRAGLVARAAEWPWSSAGVHAAACDPSGFIDLTDWLQQWSPQVWREALDSGIRDAALTERIRQATRTGRVAGSDEFVARLEAATGRRLRPLKRGPKKKTHMAADLNFEVV